MHNRKAITVYMDDISYTFLKPLSGEHTDELIVIYEDAYGDAVMNLIHKSRISDETQLDITSSRIDKICRELL